MVLILDKRYVKKKEFEKLLSHFLHCLHFIAMELFNQLFFHNSSTQFTLQLFGCLKRQSQKLLPAILKNTEKRQKNAKLTRMDSSHLQDT
ncbi:hypothetical protein CDAR_96371 [Caerostris darwini]|uniref:Uncharacterized protein n=1 Tax=Caerostris darwini TaxID=1538125 RepID=A0AAV4TE14_9ARAC|nr:hypothetical protein CDAR_96371 [Caerostris darwini]